MELIDPRPDSSGSNLGDYDCIENPDLHYPQECIIGGGNSSVNFGSFIGKYNAMMHDALSWTVVNSSGGGGGGDSIDNGSECDSELDISRFELRRNAEKECYQLLNDHIDMAMREYYLSVFAAIQQVRNYCETLRVIAQYHNLTGELSIDVLWWYGIIDLCVTMDLWLLRETGQGIIDLW